MSGSSSVGGRRGQQYSNLDSRGGLDGGSRSDGGDGGRGKGKSPAAYNDPRMKSDYQLPASSKAMRLPERPGCGTVGEKCVVIANHLPVNLDFEKDIYHYDVTITPEVAQKKVCRSIIKKVTNVLGSQTQLAYDGRKSVYTPRKLNPKNLVVHVFLNDDQRKPKQYVVLFTFAAKVDLHHLLSFLQRNQRNAPQETIQALDVVLRNDPSFKYETVGRSFFSPDLGIRRTLNGGIEYITGYYQSLRPTQMGLSLNIDISAKPFYERILVTEFITKFWEERSIPDQDFAEVRTALRGITVETIHLRYAKRLKVSQLTQDLLQNLSFEQNPGAEESVVEYFKIKHKKTLQYILWPALQCGTDSKPIYMPMEMCKVAKNQRYTRKLCKEQKDLFDAATCKKPSDRKDNISKMVRSKSFLRDALVKAFGVDVNPNLISVSARVLPCPMLMYNVSGNLTSFQPKDGVWNMNDRRMVDGGRVESWTCISFSPSCNLAAATCFCNSLVEKCREKGMVFSRNFLPFRIGRPDQIEKCLVDIHNESKDIFQRIQLLIVILPEESGYYGTIKRVCETKLGIVSQCCRPQKFNNKAKKLKDSYLLNLALKINVKVGGRNTVLEQPVQIGTRFPTDVPTIIFGADVTHPSSREDPSPSIAAVVASMDWPQVTKYRASVSAQNCRQEIIQDLYKKIEEPKENVVYAGMIRELLSAFHRSTNQWPKRIIFYRDGVSEGQFNQVLLEEVGAISKACDSLEIKDCKLTFIVVQKRHHTRLFPCHFRNEFNGNISPGTVVDDQICHPVEFDFFLCSHAGIKGTNRPIHYHVLCDENDFSSDALQELTNNLCYTHARCTRAVSVVPPAHYAHLAAFRARYYLEGEALQTIMEDIKDVMYYC